MTVTAASTPTEEAQAPAAASSSAPAGPHIGDGSAPVAEAGASEPGPSAAPETSSVPAADEGTLLKVLLSCYADITFDFCRTELLLRQHMLLFLCLTLLS